MIPALDVNDASDLDACWSAFEPTQRPRMLLWAEENIYTELGAPYDHLSYPHTGAPGGPMDAFDDPAVREIVLQWASRLGKTFVGQCATIYNGTQLRIPQIFGSANEKLALQVVQRTYKMLRHSSVLSASLVKPERLQQQHLIEFWGCSVFVGWARSAATFADKDCYAQHANEFDEWEHQTTSKDGDPGDQFTERLKNHWGVRKGVYESIPKVKGKSRVEARRLSGWDCEFNVPCPHCMESQQLEFGTPETPYGIKFEKRDGKIEAWYECRNCHKPIENHQRDAMMCRGVWVPRGCTVNHDAVWKLDVRSPDYEWRGWKHASWVKGTPINNGDVASHRLASFASLKINWNDCAEAFLNCKNRPQRLRNFKNQWEGHTWEIRRSRSEPDEIAKRIKTEYARDELPEWTEFIVLAADRQRADGGFVKWGIWASGPDEMVHLVNYGECASLDEMWTKYGRRPFYRKGEAGGEPLYVTACAVDSGWDPPGTYAFCADPSHENCVPCKGGDGTANENDSYKWTELEKSKYKEETDGMSLLLVSTNFTETAFQHLLDSGTPGKPGGLGVCAEAAADVDLISELSNAVLADKLDSRGEPVLLWVKKDDSTPNDFRDMSRYGITLIEAWRDSPHFTARVPTRVSVEKRPDGRDWIED